ncbi:unnamed protein product [Macrosiphum euphorbiae]|uniref:Uncharacterized protein n=1 Tax=Macrosiphum euphorbiae TaxID=13131 RepID=A0AAV0XR83_9HEMI|nr:unnamed protein product [Macrosiphum euphorbiae]
MTANPSRNDSELVAKDGSELVAKIVSITVCSHGACGKDARQVCTQRAHGKDGFLSPAAIWLKPGVRGPRGALSRGPVAKCCTESGGKFKQWDSKATRGR